MLDQHLGLAHQQPGTASAGRGERRRWQWLQAMPQPDQHPQSVLEGGLHVRRHLGGIAKIDHTDAQTSGLGRAIVDGARLRAGRIKPGHQLQQQAQIACGAGQRTDMVQAPAQGHRATGADRTPAWLQPDHAAVACRNAHRTHGVGAQRGRAQAGGYRCAAATTGAARRVAVAVRVMAGAVERIVVVRAHCRFMHVELANDHRAGRAQRRHRRVVVRRRGIMTAGFHAGGGDHAGHVDIVLDRHRQAFQRTRGAIGTALVRGRCRRQCALRIDVDIAVDLRLAGGNGRQLLGDQFAAAHCAGSKQGRLGTQVGTQQ